MNFREIAIGILLQNLTTFLPLAKNGHILLLEAYFSGYYPNMIIDFWIFAGVAAASLIFFLKKILINHYLPKYNYLLISPLAAAAVKYLLYKKAHAFLGSGYTLPLEFLLTANFLFFAAYFQKKQIQSSIFTLSNNLKLFLLLLFSIMPGVSALGCAYLAASMLGLKNRTALDFSLFAITPLILIELWLKYSSLPEVTYGGLYALTVALSFGASLLVAFFTIQFFRKLRLKTFNLMGLYLIAISIIQFLDHKF